MFANAVVLVTGSSSGIGLATARQVVANGGRVVLHGIDKSKLEQASRDLGRAPYVLADLARTDEVERLAREAVDVHGVVDVLVNNAAIFPRTSLEESTAEAFERIFAINARAPLLLSRSLVPAMQRRRSGSIVNIGSVNAHSGQPDLLVYSMSKAALMTMTRNMADGLAPENVRVNQLNVGWTLTETEIETQRAMGRPDNWPESIPKVFAPRGRPLLPEEVARHVVFWASELSAPVTGQVYDVEQVTFLGRNVMSRVV